MAGRLGRLHEHSGVAVDGRRPSRPHDELGKMQRRAVAVVVVWMVAVVEEEVEVEVMMMMVMWVVDERGVVLMGRTRASLWAGPTRSLVAHRSSTTCVWLVPWNR